MQQCQVKRVKDRVGQGSRFSPDLLDRLPATVEEERGREWIRTHKGTLPAENVCPPTLPVIGSTASKSTD